MEERGKGANFLCSSSSIKHVVKNVKIFTFNFADMKYLQLYENPVYMPEEISTCWILHGDTSEIL